MAHCIPDRWKEFATTYGTTDFTMAGTAEAGGFITMAAGIPANADTAWYCAVNAAAGEWEIALGTRTSSTVLARPATPLASSNAGAKVNFSAAPLVFSTVPGSKVSPGVDKIYVYQNTAANTTSAGWQKIPLDGVSFDTNSLWDATNKRVTPKKAGYYTVMSRVRTNTSGAIALAVGINGSIYAGIGADASLNASGGSAVVYCNGTTDYIECWAYVATVRALTTGAFDTYMQVVGPL